MNRRTFLKSSVCLGGAAWLPGMSSFAPKFFSPPSAHSALLDLHKNIPSPVNIGAIEALSVHGEYFVRAISSEGAVGVTMANDRLPHVLPIFKDLVAPFFIGKDARDIERLVDEVYLHDRNYKYAGLVLWNCVDHVEISLFDLLGKIAGKSVGDLLGPVRRRAIPVYLSSLRRDTTPEEEVAWLNERLAETGARAVKLKIGGRMSRNADAFPGRTEALIPLARKTFGDDVEIYVDANGSYDAEHAIAVGRMLEEHRVGFYEEPCPWEEYEATKKVADALTLTVAGGEQDTSLPRWRWMIANRAVDLLQPDLFYNGGLIRCLQVARMADDAGLEITPHNPKADPLAAPLLHFASVAANPGKHQEFRGARKKLKSWYAPHFEVRNGVVSVPTNPGLGIDYDPEIWKEAQLL